MNYGADGPDRAEVERALATALELSEGERSAFLKKLKPPIRTEVESLLNAHLAAGGLHGSDTVVQMSTIGRNPGGIEVNTRVGVYRIEAKIGEGGMGVVYRALDTKLNRPVAVKFLFDDLGDVAARRRFQRESQTASSLNHPHILTVYDTGEFLGYQYMVTEFVDGGTLASWAHAEKRTWREIVTLLVGVADGLASAHAAGILHRDVKPANILVGRNGYAKLADFGLAKLEDRPTPEAVTRTLYPETTKPGIIIGTIAYMSPEQASGRPTDARGDIFSFGVVLHELLAGRHPFRGQTDLETLQNIIHGIAPALGGDVLIPLRMMVEKSVEKDPAERYQSMQEMVVDLRRLSRQTMEPTTVATPASAIPEKSASKGSRRVWAIVAGVLVVLALSVGFLRMWLRSSTDAPRQVMQFTIAPPPGTIFAPPISRQVFAISPNGKRFAFTVPGSDGSKIWIRELDSLEMHSVPGTEGAWSIFWGPDSKSVFFSVRRTLKQANLETGSSRKVAELPHIPRSGMWRSDGTLLLHVAGGDLYELRLENGSIAKVSTLGNLRWPQLLPGGRRLLYAQDDQASFHNNAAIMDFASGKSVTLMQTESKVEYSPPLRPGEPGYLLFIRGASLLAQPFDAEQQKLAGDPFPIAQNVIYYGPNLGACFSVSANGVLVYQADFPASSLKWYDRSGKEVGEAGRPSPYWGQVRVSRDGRRVAATLWNPDDGSTGVWAFDSSGRDSRRLTFPPEVHRRAVWSPDGTQLTLGRSPTVGGPELGIVDSSGNVSAQRFTKTSDDYLNALPTDWSWDGKFIALDDGVAEEQHTLWIADAETHKLMPLLKKDYAQWGTAFSRDSKSIAFVSLESGRPEIYVQAFEASPAPHVVGDRRQVSRDGAWLVRWRPDGRELFFLGMDNSLQAAPVGANLQPGEPKLLFRVAGASQYGTTRDFQFDVSPDGQRFIIPTTGAVPPPPFTVIENWQDKFRH